MTNFSEKNELENFYLGCQFFMQGIDDYLSGINIMKMQTRGTIGLSSSLVYKAWDKLWQANRILTNNGHLLKEDGRVYSLADFLKEVGQIDKKTKDGTHKKGVRKLCSTAFLHPECPECSLCSIHINNIDCTCYNCIGRTFPICKVCKNKKIDCKKCIRCGEAKLIMTNKLNHNYEILEFLGYSPLISLSPFEVLGERNNLLHREIVAINIIRNQDQHGYVLYDGSEEDYTDLRYKFVKLLLSNRGSFEEAIRNIRKIFQLSCKARDKQFADTNCCCSLLETEEALINYLNKAFDELVKEYDIEKFPNLNKKFSKSSIEGITRKEIHKVLENSPYLKILDKSVKEIDKITRRPEGSKTIKTIIHSLLNESILKGYRLMPQNIDNFAEESFIKWFIKEELPVGRIYIERNNIDRLNQGFLIISKEDLIEILKGSMSITEEARGWVYHISLPIELQPSFENYFRRTINE